MLKKDEGAQRLAPLGHNAKAFTIRVEARLFNSLSKYAKSQGPFARLSLPAGSTIEDVVRACGVPRHEIFLVLRNGRDVTPGLVGADVNVDTVLADGDVVALSGPVPFSYGYGAPVV